ncbi:MAG: 1-deoxy-D-xylulose-5-phosphate reductoisomerase [Flavobacteriales bacterium]
MKEGQRGVAILGSTGSIGCQAIEVIRSKPDYFRVEVLTAMHNADLLIEQASALNPNAVVIGNVEHFDKVRDALSSTDIKVFAGEESITQVVDMDGIDLVLAAIVGFAGLKSTLAAIEAGQTVALANKETLVVAGELITKKLREHAGRIIPVDSEHSAIFQCLAGELHNRIEKIYLTGSGGPFRGYSKEKLRSVGVEDALNHPNWDMGEKITIDSATLMNKGLEVIEAKWLFNLLPSQIEVVIHPQSIVHSIVQFDDGSMKAQMGLPDMKLPIQYALAYPERLHADYRRFSFEQCATLNFEKPDTDIFRNLQLAYDALDAGGNVPCILNAANEVAVNAFLTGKTTFLKITDIIEYCMKKTGFSKDARLETYMETDAEARRFANELI